jgi:hypothetical protein
VTAQLSYQVELVMQKVQAILLLTENFNLAMQNIVLGADLAQLSNEVTAIVNAIPTVPAFDLTDLAGYLSCPLTILVLPGLVNAVNKDARLLYYQMSAFYEAEIRQIRSAYDVSYTNTTSADTLAALRLYVVELQRLVVDPYAFAIDFATATAITSYVSETCPEIYADPQWVFAAFVESIGPVAFLNGLIPSTLVQSAQGIIETIWEGEAKILAWQQILTEVV